jgi:hypothetical protein
VRAAAEIGLRGAARVASGLAADDTAGAGRKEDVEKPHSAASLAIRDGHEVIVRAPSSDAGNQIHGRQGQQIAGAFPTWSLAKHCLPIEPAISASEWFGSVRRPWNLGAI